MPGKENMAFWESIIGLEIHIELKTKSKMFCHCSADYFGHEPNTHVCPVCLGLPGALPVANQKAVEWTVLAGLALGCKIPLFSKFDRKNYFYPDLPKGYQISQYDMPLAINGQLQSKINNPDLVSTKSRTGQQSTIGIRRVHLEEDTAKLIHTESKGKRMTLIDFNRSGVPLMEIVTEPDIRSAQKAKEFLKKLQQIIRYLGISDCDMEKGSMRCEANVSIYEISNDKFLISNQFPIPNDQLPKYKVEIKNLNSFRFVGRAVDYEIQRQIKLLEKGKKPIQETRGWDEKRQVTYPQRTKEEAQDYRYFPEPDLPPIRWEKLEIEKLRNSLPELPDKKAIRFQKQYGLNPDQIGVLTATREKADYFEEAVKVGRKHQVLAEKLANVIINKRIDTSKLLPAELIQILIKRQTRLSFGKEELEQVVNRILGNNVGAVADYKAGKKNAIEFLVGQVMRETKGRADPKQARRLLKNRIKS